MHVRRYQRAATALCRYLTPYLPRRTTSSSPQDHNSPTALAAASAAAALPHEIEKFQRDAAEWYAIHAFPFSRVFSRPFANLSLYTPFLNPLSGGRVCPHSLFPSFTFDTLCAICSPHTISSAANGPARALHSLGATRAEFISQHLTPSLLRGITVLDIGCGGGILSERYKTHPHTTHAIPPFFPLFHRVKNCVRHLRPVLHFATITIPTPSSTCVRLARLGARVTGIDASPNAIAVAREHAETHVMTMYTQLYRGKESLLLLVE
jgi:hypothetical protein